MTSASVRRARLWRWLLETEHPVEMTANQIVDRTDVYEGHGRYDRCFDDLKWLAHEGHAERVAGTRPSRWRIVV